MEPLLQVENLRVGFDTPGGFLRAVEDVSFDIRRGEVLGLVGESGCGKSVTALSLLRLLAMPPAKVEQGRVWLEGEDVLTATPERLREIRGGRIGFIFQEPATALSPLHRIGEQLIEAGMLHGLTRAAAEAEARVRLQDVGVLPVEERMKAWPHELSGGMRQRVMIAMALLPKPALLIADEPTTALDVTVQAQIFKLLTQVRGQDTALLLITHDMALAWQVCDRLMVMYAARLVETGPREAVFAHPAHPYTSGLLDAIPPLTGERTRLKDIPGRVPPPLAFPPGCRFAPRCPRAQPICRERAPAFKEITPGHHAACWNPLTV